LLGIPVTVFMPSFAPSIKIETCRRLGARVELQGSTFSEATAAARLRAREENLTYIHGFKDPAIIAGAGVCGLEILEQVPDVEAILVPVGGGGLIAGIATAVKALRPDVRVIGVEPEGAACLQAALRAGAPVEVAVEPTLADGLCISRVGELPFQLLKGRLDGMVCVSEEEIGLAILRLIELEKSVVEGAGAAGVAALLAGKLPELRGKRVVLPLCGGNIDPAILGRVIERALVYEGRLTRLKVSISDRPGGLAKLAETVAATGASIRQILHDRAFGGPGFAQVVVDLTVDTRDSAHAAALRLALRKAGLSVD
jgi:threonine dehydratase